LQISSFVGRAFGAAASVALLASCSGVTSQGTPAVGSSVGQSSAHVNTLNRSRLLGKTSVSARGYVSTGKVTRSSGGGPLVDKKTQVVYVSDAENEAVYGYDQTGGSPIITLGGFSEPQGLATDNIGSVYVANTEDFNIEVFPAGSTTASLTIPTNGYPAGVAVGGNYIYVSNIIGLSSNGGSLQSFYKKNGAAYRTYSCPALEEAFFVATDSKANVYVDGFDTSFSAVVWEFPQGSLSCTQLPITLNFPGGLQVDKSGNLLVDDQEGDTTSYAPPGFTTVVATSDNGGSESYDPVTIALTKGNANIWTATAGAETLTEWPYPASGTPSLTISGLAEPIGVATYERGNK
jgi:hypothetical protein